MTLERFDPADLVPLVLSVRSLAARFKGIDLSPPAEPFDPAADIANTRIAFQSLIEPCPLPRLIELRDGALTRSASDEALCGLGQVVNRAEARLYSEIMVRRGTRRPPLAAPRPERPEVEAVALRLAFAAFFPGIPDETLIRVNRDAYARYLSLGEHLASPQDQAESRALQLEMAFLAYYMDVSGVTERFIARQTPRTLN